MTTFVVVGDDVVDVVDVGGWLSQRRSCVSDVNGFYVAPRLSANSCPLLLVAVIALLAWLLNFVDFTVLRKTKESKGP